jgi:hypothetical protein
MRRRRGIVWKPSLEVKEMGVNDGAVTCVSWARGVIVGFSNSLRDTPGVPQWWRSLKGYISYTYIYN